MLALKRAPLQYRQCTQTVTVYHKENDAIIRRVFNRAYLDYRKNRNIDKTGSSDANSFLLVIPMSENLLSVGDKVIMGIGDDITVSEWPAFNPHKVNGLVVIKYIDPKYYGDKLVHVEAGG